MAIGTHALGFLSIFIMNRLYQNIVWRLYLELLGLLYFQANMALLPLPRLNIVVNQVNFDRIIQAFQDLRYIGEMRQRWVEIKKLLKGGLPDVIPAAMQAK